MKPEVPDREFERRLRDVLHSRQLSVDPAADAIEKIHAGARHRQRRQRAATSGLAAVAVVGLAITGIVLRPANHGGNTVADGVRTPTITSLTTSDSPAQPSPSLAFGSANKLASSAPSPAVSAPESVPATAATIPAGGAPPTGFVPLSVTAVNKNTFWVLGHAPCSAGTCTGVAKTTDGGKTFTEVGAPLSGLGSDVPGSRDVYGPSIISDIRFGDGQNGWAYGGGLWQTTDGGQTWNAVSLEVSVGRDGAVERLAAANNRVWAIVLTGASSMTSSTYGLYSATYPGGTWAKVSSAGSFGPSLPMLAVQGTTAVVIGNDATTGAERAIAATGGSTTFTNLPGGLPCTAAPGDPLSATTNALWLACTSATGKSGGAYVSPDFGHSWHVASPVLSDATVAIGALDAKSAIMSDRGMLVRVSADGSTGAVTAPDVPVTTTWSFIGFTDGSDGFAIPIVNDARQLWRTTDGGAHWSVVKF